MGSWFTPRPVSSYRARWLGDNLAAIEADPVLPSRLTFAVQPGGELRVTDPVLSLMFDVAVGSWFNEFQAWTPEQLVLTEQPLPDQGPWEYWITGGELPELVELTGRVGDLEAALGALETGVTALVSTVSSVVTGVGVLEASVAYQEFGQANVSGVLLADATTDVTVTWTGTLPVTDYQVRLVSVASGLLGSLVLDSIVSRTTTQCTARLRATALLTLSGSVVLSASCVA